MIFIPSGQVKQEQQRQPAPTACCCQDQPCFCQLFAAVCAAVAAVYPAPRRFAVWLFCYLPFLLLLLPPFQVLPPIQPLFGYLPIIYFIFIFFFIFDIRSGAVCCQPPSAADQPAASWLLSVFPGAAASCCCRQLPIAAAPLSRYLFCKLFSYLLLGRRLGPGSQVIQPPAFAAALLCFLLLPSRLPAIFAKLLLHFFFFAMPPFFYFRQARPGQASVRPRPGQVRPGLLALSACLAASQPSGRRPSSSSGSRARVRVRRPDRARLAQRRQTAPCQVQPRPAGSGQVRSGSGCQAVSHQQLPPASLLVSQLALSGCCRRLLALLFWLCWHLPPSASWLSGNSISSQPLRRRCRRRGCRRRRRCTDHQVRPLPPPGRSARCWSPLCCRRLLLSSFAIFQVFQAQAGRFFRLPAAAHQVVALPAAIQLPLYQLFSFSVSIFHLSGQAGRPAAARLPSTVNSANSRRWLLALPANRQALSGQQQLPAITGPAPAVPAGPWPRPPLSPISFRRQLFRVSQTAAARQPPGFAARQHPGQALRCRAAPTSAGSPRSSARRPRPGRPLLVS